MRTIDYASVNPEWPVLGFMFDTPVFDRYVWSLVRMLEFAALLEPDHPCLLEELEMFKTREAILKDHIQSFKSNQLWEAAVDVARRKLRAMAIANLHARETDEDIEQALRESILEYDFVAVLGV